MANKANVAIVNLFQGQFSEIELLRTCEAVGLVATDCTDDETPHYSVAVEEDGEPVWQLNKLANGNFLLVWFDPTYLPQEREIVDLLIEIDNFTLREAKTEASREGSYVIDLVNHTPAQVADLIRTWRNDEGAYFGAACDLLNSIEPYLRQFDLAEPDSK